ncbi:MAG: hypothetical protein ACM3Q2_09465 [Syntrophothermus sp.]
MENISCSGCKAYNVNYEGSRHDCRLGFPIKCIGMEKFIQTHLYGPKEKCPRPLTDERFEQIILPPQKTASE